MECCCIENTNPSNWHVIIFDRDKLDYYLYYGCTFGYRYSNTKGVKYIFLSGVKYIFLSSEIHSCIVEVI